MFYFCCTGKKHFPFWKGSPLLEVYTMQLIDVPFVNGISTNHDFPISATETKYKFEDKSKL